MLVVEHISKSFGDTAALHELSLTAAAGEIVAILGPSGCGKSTLLQVIAGLLTPDAGDVRWEGSSQLQIPTHRRGFGLMFQDYALFPHRNVFDNIAFGLKMKGLSRPEIQRRVPDLLQQVGLSGLETRDVNTLSGGEQQRVALARALAPKPRLLMLDEPLGSLDRTLRDRLMAELRAMLQREGLTVLYVTHDQHEAFAIADRIVVLRAGHVAQIGTPQQIYRQPASEFVARFLGMNNILVGQLETRDSELCWQLSFGSFPIGESLALAAGVEEVRVLLPPTAAELASEGNGFVATVTSHTFRGSVSEVGVQPASGQPLQFAFGSSLAVPPLGSKIWLRLKTDMIVGLPEDAR